MKTILLTALLALALGSTASSDGKPVARAWPEHAGIMAEGPYVYASIGLPTDAIYLLANIDGPGNDPFAVEEKNSEKKRQQLDKFAPIVSNIRLPLCLPRAITYRNVSKLLAKNGVALKGREWALHGADPMGHERIYFCTTLENADIIEQIFQVLTPIGPRTLKQLATLVSVPNLDGKNTAWTLETWNRLSPNVHGRYGIHGRSGEKFRLRISRDNTRLVDYEIEPTLGENNQLADFRLAFCSKIPDSQGVINQETAVTVEIGLPFILDCGVRDKSRRNYFLILQTSVEAKEHPGIMSPLVSLKTIDGIYAFPAKPPEPKTTDAKLVTHSYLANTRFLTKFRDELDAHHRDSGKDPFSKNDQKAPQQPKPPARVTDLKSNQHHASRDVVYDITPHLRYLGMHLFQNEWVYFNKSRNSLIIHGVPSLHSGVTRYADTICPTPQMIRIQAEIVEVDRDKLLMVDWKTNDLKAAGSNLLAKYSTVVRSGKKATYGASATEEKTAEPSRNKGKSLYELEIEPVASEDSRWIDVRYSIRSNPLGDERLVMGMDSALTLSDGIPDITEIGHSNSTTKTHLLVFRADVITPGGRFYRNRFKPLDR